MSRFANLPAAMVGVAGVAMLVSGPIPQPADYHDFADRRVVAGIPHAYDVLSNVGFLLAGAWGLALLWRRRIRQHTRTIAPAYGLFFSALVLTAAGSAFYHLQPDNARLVWDRLPIALACAGLLAAVRAELRPDVVANELRDTVVMAALAALTVAWWRITEWRGEEDLRPYLLLQAAPLVVVPLWQAIYGAPRRDRTLFAAAVAFYVVAKLAEVNDHQLYAWLNPVSGHTIKHLLAGAASALIAVHLQWTSNRTASLALASDVMR